jgi:hypothetical protein
MKHICGEHGEIHKHLHNFVKHHSITGRIFPIVQIQPMAMHDRHNELSMFLKNHKSPYTMPDLSYLPDKERLSVVDQEESMRELYRRCEDCRKIMDMKPFLNRR